MHPHQPRRAEAVSLEARAQRLGHERGVEVDSPMFESGQRLIGESDQLLDAHAGIVVNSHNVEVEVVGIAARSEGGPVLPRLDLMTDELLPPPRPGHRTSHKFRLPTEIFKHLREAIAATEYGHLHDPNRDSI